MTPKHNLSFRKATNEDINSIWVIIQESIERRRKDGSQQWQNGYPNWHTIEDDINKNYGFVLCLDNEIAVYVALILNDEPAYNVIEGAWLTTGDFVVVHRVAIAEKFAGKGLTKILFDYIEIFSKSKKIFSIKVDTNFDNIAMLNILEKKGYTYCGEVYLDSGKRKAYEKVLVE